MADETNGDSSSSLSLVRAIVLDANAFNSRQLHRGRLVDLMKRVGAHGQLEVWLPETVLWEWAEHAYAERVTAGLALRRIRATGLALPPLPERSREDVLAELEAALAGLGDSLVILEIDDDVAAAALRDQILLLGPAKARSDKSGRAIKTGASDSALLRSVLRRAGDDTATFVVVSRDADLPQAFKRWEITPPAIYSSVSEALDAVVAMVPPDAELPWQCLSLLAESIDEKDLGRLSSDRDVFSEMSTTGYADEVRNQQVYAVEEQDRQVVGLSRPFLDREAGYLTGTVHLLTVAAATGIAPDAWGDAMVQHDVELWGATVRITATFELDPGGRPVELAFDEGEGVVLQPDPVKYKAAEDALADVLDALTAIPGMEDLDWPEVFDNQETKSIKLHEEL